MRQSFFMEVILSKRLLLILFSQLRICHELIPTTQANYPKYLLAGGEQRCVRKLLWASCPQQCVWRAAARGVVRQRFVLFGVLQMTFFGWQTCETNYVYIGIMNKHSNTMHMHCERTSCPLTCSTRFFFWYNGTWVGPRYSFAWEADLSREAILSPALISVADWLLCIIHFSM